ncbi:uroporphyrinogen-III synthase [Alicyclobacillus vulcanalis]|uniref:Uroporphyrinogen-III synthase n=1 Tax=Alicyclobacillus vulcanalis TaxID=252246 RepID=A0A1N7KQV3_9BACL|nr:uroporphyrinogen-III synthase [Alicyclobacillus vulcanalis]SIS64022.1 uroporphyrinogen-III synthase [Alicyclobacillus vulcanalis]
MARPPVIVTQSGDRGASLAATLRRRGFAAEHVPLVETVTRIDAVRRLPHAASGPAAWVFTSAAAIRAIRSFEPAAERLRAAPFAFALGEATWRELRAVHNRAHHFPGVRGASEFADRLIASCPPSLDFVFPCGNLALEALPDALRRAGRRVEAWMVYDTLLRPEAVERLAAQKGGVVVLFSPSAVAAIGAHPSRGEWLASGRFVFLPFGQTTAKALDELGVWHLDPPPEPSHEALLGYLETLYPMGA